MGNILATEQLSRQDNSKYSWLSSFFTSSEPTSSVVTDGVVSTVSIPRSDFEGWLQVQEAIAFKGILNNIGGFGGFEESDNVTVGAVIASPSKKRPNYFYQWIRDGAITINSLVEYLEDHQFDDSEYDLAPVIESYIINAYQIQRVNNPSGDFESLEGLGEPKFMPDSTPFTDHWGRPQRDGPGLRVITITNYLSLLKKYGRSLIKSDELHSEEFIYNEIIKPDLKYIIKSWNKSGFDLWEEVDSLHLFTSLTQLKAIKNGLEYATRYDKEFYDELARTFNALRFFISVDSGYRIQNVPYLIETPSLLAQSKRSGLDIASILGSLRAHDLDTDDTLDIPFPIDDASVLNTLAAMVNDMKYRYPINHNRLGFSTGFALGRYPEDVYDGYGTSEGNPWFIATATASELIYKIVYNLYSHQKDLIIPLDHKMIFESITNMKIEGETILPYGSDAFIEATSSLFRYADAFMDVIREHVDNDGHMSEQFNKYSGYMEGAEDLTWSYGALWSSMRWRIKSLKIMNNKELNITKSS
ncbi:glycoside hydrolase family 15 protein [[Candida] arabinofermentans NRRL YB-2248]|uniref:glucan 1,4-alpha-glucosidase n=1 Tax=[Candida] arabinofermentans NRRL YB-2248 TaxID=983967 RepID=A0A1E4SSR4_9ASCO|nr:glycoside hydrolase family 15 protein [[Candida] arabinofermentans NRRL YB-2248]